MNRPTPETALQRDIDVLLDLIASELRSGSEVEDLREIRSGLAALAVRLTGWTEKDVEQLLRETEWIGGSDPDDDIPDAQQR